MISRRTKLLSAFALALSVSVAWAGDLPKPVSDADFIAIDMREAELGQLLFWDPILSGNKNISCGTCHHPKLGTADGVSLSIGEGGIGLGPDRKPDAGNMPEHRIPRNAPGLFNLGAKEFVTMFHDGRLEADTTKKSGLRTPMDDDMTVGFASVLSAQAMFPVLSSDEMAGHYSENDVSKAVRQGLITGEGGAWDIIAKRVSAIEQYRDMFARIDDEIAAGKPIHFTDISNVIAAFIAFEWRADNSAFDNHLRGKVEITGPAATGMELFYGKANCGTCHTGAFQTDHQFHAMGVPQLGPGKAASFEYNSQDTGRERVTGKPEDMYAFRTPSLRNVKLTAPYGHNGAYRDLRNFVEAHMAPATAITNYDRSEVLFTSFTPSKDDWAALNDAAENAAIIEAVKTPSVDLNDQEIDALMAFLDQLTDREGADGRLGIPQSVPSGLPVDR